MKLEKDYYLQEDVVGLAKDLLGKVLVTNFNGLVTSGLIVETEAYKAPEDKASHAYNYKRTSRTEVFYLEGGHAYVYLCYGIHYLFNIITNKINIPHAILVRAIQPISGIDIMLKRRKKEKLDYTLSSGPGSVSMALGISKTDNGTDLTGNTIWIEDQGSTFKEKEIIASSRIGIDYAEQWKDVPWRFRVKDNPWTSKAK